MIVLVSKFKSAYCECPSYNIIGVFSDAEKVKIGIEEHKSRLHSILGDDADMLLKDTEFLEREFVLDIPFNPRGI